MRLSKLKFFQVTYGAKLDFQGWGGVQAKKHSMHSGGGYRNLSQIRLVAVDFKHTPFSATQ